MIQAQECILEKSLLDNRKPGIIAKVCGQVVEYYKQALKQLEFSSLKEAENHLDSFFDVVGSKQSRYWRAYLEFKISYYVCLSYLHMGMASEETGRWGERVAYFEAANTALGLAVRTNKEYKVESLFKGVTDALVYTNDVVNGKLDISKKENEFIYHEKVPEIESLPSIKGASLVKGIPFDEQDSEVSGGDLFSRIVTLETHAASSMYSEELAKILRTVGGEIEVANDSLVMYLSSLQLEDIPDTDSLSTMPQEIIDCVAGLSVRPQCVPQLQQAMAKLAGVSADVEASLQEIQQMLKEEEREEEEFVSVLGPRPRPLMSELERETQKYHAAHSMASESNLTLHEAMRLHVKNLKMLSQSVDGLQTTVPSLSSLDDSTLSSLEDMRKIMMKVDEMRSQRRQLEQDLRNAVQEDDITGRIAVKGSAEAEKIFVEELKKHDRIIGYIRQNIAAQGAIVQAMSERNAEYADARYKVDSVMRQREEALGHLVASYHAYEDLLNKTTKGLEFYDKLDGNVSKLLDRVKGVVKVQNEERTQVLRTSEQKAAEARALSLSLISGGGLGDKINFSPAAPPPDTPENESMSFNTIPSVVSGNDTTAFTPAVPPVGGRPKLSDFLSGGYKPSGSSGPPGQSPAAPAHTVQEPSRRPKLSDFLKARDQKGQDNLGVRPPPVGASNPDPPAGSSCGPTASVAAMSQPQPPTLAFHNMHLAYVPSQLGTPPIPSTIESKDVKQVPSTQSTTHQQEQQQFNMQQHYFMMQQQYFTHQQYNQNIQKPVSTTSTTYSAPTQPLASSQPQQHQQPQHYYGQLIQQQHQPGQQAQQNLGQHFQQPVQSHQQKAAEQQQPGLHQDQGQQHLQMSYQQIKQHGHRQDYTMGQQQQQQIQIPSYQKAQMMPGQQQKQMQDQCQRFPGEPQQHCPPGAGYNVSPESSESKKEVPHQQQPQGIAQPPAKMPGQPEQGQALYPNYPQQYLHQHAVVNSPFQQMYQQFHNPNVQKMPDSPKLQLGITSQHQPAPASTASYINHQEQALTYPHQQQRVSYPHQPNITPEKQNQQQQNSSSLQVHQPGASVTPTPASAGPSSNLTLLSEMAAPAPAPAVPMPGTVRPPPTNPASLAPEEIEQSNPAPELKSVDNVPFVTQCNLTIVADTNIKNIIVPDGYLEKKLQNLETYLSNLTNKTLEETWRQILTQFEHLQKKKESVSVARCYPFANRAPDVLPFDFNRLVLKDCRDDYINASLVTTSDSGKSSYVVTQTPLAKNKADFWSLIWQEGTETVICLATDLEMAEGLYLPCEKNMAMKEGEFTVNVQSLKTNDHFTERVVNLHHSSLKQTRALLHLQTRAAPEPRSLARAVIAMTDLRAQQRFPAKPVLVHCTDGGNRSGAYLAVSSLMADMGLLEAGWPVVTTTAAHLLTQRKGIIRDKTVTKVIVETLLEFLKIKLDRDDEDIVIIAEKTSTDVQDFVGLSVASLKAELQPTSPEDLRSRSDDVQYQNHDVSADEADGKPKSPTITQLELDLGFTPLTPVTHIPTDLTKLADISVPALETKTRKFSKEDFHSPSKKIGPSDNSADPLSQLDPLWSLK